MTDWTPNETVRTTLTSPWTEWISSQPWFQEALDQIRGAVAVLREQGFDGSLNLPDAVLHVGRAADGLRGPLKPERRKTLEG